MTTSTGSVTLSSGLPGDPAAPEPLSGFNKRKQGLKTQSYRLVTAKPQASKAGCNVLKAGGSAVDAAVAVQRVLGLVEPQSSGLGGGAFMLHYNATTKGVVSYNGRETAPAAASENYLRWIDDTTGQTAPLRNVRASGRSIGTPSAVRMLGLAQQATAMVDFGASNSVNTNVGGKHPNVDVTKDVTINGANDALITGLRALGHTVNFGAPSSGISTILRISRDNGMLAWAGGVDPRREGLVLGDGY